MEALARLLHRSIAAHQGPYDPGDLGARSRIELGGGDVDRSGAWIEIDAAHLAVRAPQVEIDHVGPISQRLLRASPFTMAAKARLSSSVSASTLTFGLLPPAPGGA